MRSNHQTLNRGFLACSTAVLLASVLVVSNAVASELVRSETVKFQDLNVNTPAGVEALYSRIHLAAKHVCTVQGDWEQRIAARACAKDAEARAIRKVNLPSLTAYYRVKTGDHTETLASNR